MSDTTQPFAGLPLHGDAYFQPNLYAALISTSIIMIIAAVLRMIARNMTKANFWLDDTLALIAFITALGFDILALVDIHDGLGRHFDQSIATRLPNFLKRLYAIEILYPFPLIFAKFSLLAMYWRLFNKSRNTRIAVYVAGIVTLLWGVGTIVAAMAQCTPAASFWDLSIPGKCINVYAHLLSSALIDFVTAVAILVLPIPVVWKLNINIRQKIALTLSFAMGAFVCVWPLYRAVIMIQRPNFTTQRDYTANVGMVALGVFVEINLGVTAACTPCLRPILIWLIPSTSSRDHSERSSFKSIPMVKQLEDRAKMVRGLGKQSLSRNRYPSSSDDDDYKRFNLPSADPEDFTGREGSMTDQLGVLTVVNVERQRSMRINEDGIIIKREVTVE